jgi:hypothetical protein
MSSFTTINGKQVEVKPTPGSETTSLPTRQTHHADCGDVGDVGKHGNLGTNHADGRIDLSPTEEAAVEILARKGFSFPASIAIVKSIGADAVTKPKPGNTSAALNFALAHGYQREGAQVIVDRVGASILNAVEEIADHDPEAHVVSLWDFTA